MVRFLFVCSVLISLLSACASQAPVETTAEAPAYAPPIDSHCASDRILADAHFEGGMLGECMIGADGVFELTMYPENPPPINVSPWYAFRLSGEEGNEVTVRIRFQDGYARYWPKTSTDGDTWSRMPEDQVVISEDGTTMELSITMPRAQMWIAGQELWTSRYYDDWLIDLAQVPESRTRLLGESVQGRPIYLVEVGQADETVLLIGRQHPPELTGPAAMRPFVEAVTADTELANAFRERFRVVILPMLNPDGVAAGFWRHNMNGVDLNRDWGPFTQPETQLVRDWLAADAQSAVELQLMLDFHSTKKNVFYTQKDEHPTDPPEFTQTWLDRSAQRLPDYPFDREGSETFEQPNTKNYFYTTYGIPSITFETGDETDRQETADAAVVFAEEMMRVLLETPQD